MFMTFLTDRISPMLLDGIPNERRRKGQNPVNIGEIERYSYQNYVIYHLDQHDRSK